jgi:hypothetical protein
MIIILGLMMRWDNLCCWVLSKNKQNFVLFSLEQITGYVKPKRPQYGLGL